MFYQAIVTGNSERWSAVFPDCPGCQTQADDDQELRAMAKEALEGWLETHLACGDVPPQPCMKADTHLLQVDIDPVLAMRIQVRLARHKAGWTQQDLADRAGVSLKQIVKLEHPDLNAKMATITKVAEAFGISLDVRFEAVA
ncbi:MAG: type II toxin-antitoxin system HicB family antitoxin [Polyangiaceae bacterium]|nr:type II toxin-antitoxin system HicB family antitoxin [Polyangiaceae bacterium]